MGLFSIKVVGCGKSKTKPKMLSRLWRVPCHNGLEIVLVHFLAAVKNIWQCIQVRPSKCPKVKFF